MANLTPTVRKRRKDGFWQVYIRVTVGTQVSYITTDKYVHDKGLGKANSIIDPFVMQYCANLIIEYRDKLNRVDTSRWNSKQIVEYLKSTNSNICFSDFARLHMERMINIGQERNARNYHLAVQHLENYLGSDKVVMEELTSKVLNNWIASLSETHRAKEMYPICIRQIYKAAMREYNDEETGIIRIKSNPWGKVKIPSADKAQQIAISAELCREFFSIPLPESIYKEPKEEFGRDIAKLVLCLGGINTVDLYNLKKTDYKNGIISYKRAKTRKARRDEAYIEMRVEPILYPLLEKYKGAENEPYLFNFHKRLSSSDSFCSNANVGIRRVCELMGLPKEQWFSVYTFRHTWGTIAQNDCGATIEEVAFGMNHSRGLAITRGYIKMDFSPAWELNKRVIDFVFFSNAPSKQGGAASGADEPAGMFRIFSGHMIYARAYFRGEVVAEVSDIGFTNKDEIMRRLIEQMPSDAVPAGSAVQFRIKDCDTEREAVYEKKKGKGF